jgi:hypothetical protein
MAVRAALNVQQLWRSQFVSELAVVSFRIPSFFSEEFDCFLSVVPHAGLVMGKLLICHFVAGLKAPSTDNRPVS